MIRSKGKYKPKIQPPARFKADGIDYPTAGYNNLSE
jgi:hypothetical protein